MAKFVIPKRKEELVGEYNETSRYLASDYAASHTQEVYNTLQYWISFLDGKFTYRLQIPVGADMTDGTPGQIWIEGTNFHYIDENGDEQSIAP